RRGEHGRMNHSAAEHLEPAGSLADAASSAGTVLLATEDAADVRFCAWFDEGEIARPEADRRRVAVETLGEGRQYALELREGHVPCDVKPFNLVEHRRVGDIVVAPVDGSTTHESEGRPVIAHLPHLHAARVRPQKRPPLCGRARDVD